MAFGFLFGRLLGLLFWGLWDLSLGCVWVGCAVSRRISMETRGFRVGCAVRFPQDFHENDSLNCAVPRRNSTGGRFVSIDVYFLFGISDWC